MNNTEFENRGAFVPVGAIAFFIALSAFFALVWFGFYALLIFRQNG